MARYLARECPQCKGYLGVVVPERKPKLPVQATNGHCAQCGYGLAWIVIHGRSVIPDFKYQRHLSPTPD